MSRVILVAAVSLDGFFEGPGRDISWHLVDEEHRAHMNAELAGMGGFLSGRVSWELMAGFWPPAAADPASPPAMKTFARIWMEMPKVVYTRTLAAAGWNTTIARAVVPAEVEALKAGARGDLVVGAGALGAEFLRQGLVDELRLYLQPILLGEGRRPFPEGPARVPFTLVEARRFASGVMLLRYGRGRGA